MMNVTVRHTSAQNRRQDHNCTLTFVLERSTLSQ